MEVQLLCVLLLLLLLVFLIIAILVVMKGCLITVFICIFLMTIVGEGNGNPLQYSCLENPMGRGAW